METSEKVALSPEETRGFFDWYLVDAFGYHGAVLVQWIKHSSQYGWHKGAWRSTMEDISVFLGLRARATYDVVDRLKKAGALIVEKKPERKSPNGYALHFSVNEERVEEIRLQSERNRIEEGRFEFLRRKGTTSKPAKGSTGTRPRTAKGTAGRKAPTDTGTVGTRPPAGGEDCRQRTADLTETPTSRNTSLPETHTRAELAGLVPSDTDRAGLATLGPTGVSSIKEKNHSRKSVNTPAKEVSKVSRGEASDRAPSQDRSSFSVAAVEKAWSEAVAAVYGGRYPALAPQKSHLEAVIRFGEKNGFSPVDYVRWFVANWDSLRHGVKTNWMNLAEFPVFSSITHLRDKALPFFLAAVEHPEAWEKRLLTKEERQRQSEEASRKWEAERPQREAEARKRAEAQVLEARMKRYTTDRDYYRPEEVPADHPQREGILNYTRNGIPVRANSYTYERLDDISLREARQGGFRTYSRG